MVVGRPSRTLILDISTVAAQPDPVSPAVSIRDGHSPAFLITIDTEGDNLWSRPRTLTTRNAEFLPRFQALCEAFGLRPTYLVTHEMATSPAFREFAGDLLRRRTGEIGMHLHAWNTPPIVPLTSDDWRFQPYLTEYPHQIIEQKVAVMTGLLEETFGVKMLSHRAGRWGFSSAYARVLVSHGYRVDCSVTPYVSWTHHRGAGNGGSDFTRFPTDAYFVDLDDIGRPGSSPLLEVPMTIVPSRQPWRLVGRRALDGWPLAQRAWERLAPSVHWLRPNGRNRKAVLRVLRLAEAERRSYVEFMLHSSELMPGGSPRFPGVADIERLYRDLEALFDAARGRFGGTTLFEFCARVAETPGGPHLAHQAVGVGSSGGRVAQ